MPIYLQYYFWLFSISLLFIALEHLRPWRPQQEAIRKGLVQDLFWLVFNKQYIGWMLALGTLQLISLFDSALSSAGLPTVSDLQLLSDFPVYIQLLLAFLIKDFIEWNVHRMLHRVPWMWEFHKLHHSIEELDWLGAFRTHWGELVIYRLISFLPLVILGVDSLAIFIISALSAFIQELSHSNLKWDGGPLRYLLNSPRFHSWHHDVKLHGKGGQNFAVNLSVWDWLFGTAYYPSDSEQPQQYGFKGMSRYPQSVVSRLLYPFVRSKK